MSDVEGDFLESLSLKEVEPYRGRWIAIVGREIVASGKELPRVYQEAIKKSNGKTPLIEHFPESLEETTYIL